MIDSLDPGPVKRHYAAYVDIAAQVRELRKTGDLVMATNVAALQLVPAFGIVQQDLNAAKASLEARATSAEVWRDDGSVLILILGGLFLMLMFRHADRMRRRLAAREL